jgi:ATP-binding cassette, subfamily B, multidrug efflux pump
MSQGLAPLLRLLGRSWRRYALGAVALAVSDAGQLLIANQVGRATDALAAGATSVTVLTPYVAAMIGCAIFVAVARYVWRQYIFGTSRMIERALRQRLYDHLQTLPAAFYLQHKIGDLMAHATNDVPAVQNAAAGGMMAALDAVIIFIGASAMMVFTVDWRLGLVCLAPLVFITPGTYWLGKRLHARYGDVQAAFSVVSDRAQENISGIRVVKGFAREGQQIGYFDEAAYGYRDTFADMLRYDAAFDPMINILAGVSFALALAYGGLLVVRGTITLGSYVAFNSYLSMIVWPMLAMGLVMNNFQRASASLARLQALFDIEPEVRDAPAAQALPAPRGHVTLRGLTFRYGPELPLALAGVDLDAPPGRTVGIIGRTGCGKSTIAAVLTRVFNPPPGQVLLDGVDVNELQLADLRRAIAVVPQDAFLFSRTVADNIAFDARDHGPDEIQAAARTADIDGEIGELPNGYDTMVGERGITLSGGQRQRLCLARALVKDAPVLVLDDCLSAVDTMTETRILAALRPYMADRTTIIIAHRVSALRDADEIIVLAHGRVVERGSHEQLMAVDGDARLWRKQQLEAAIVGMPA